jgi:hypothetical protein
MNAVNGDGDVNREIEELIGVLIIVSGWSEATCTRMRRHTRRVISEMEGPDPTDTQAALARVAVGLDIGHRIIGRQLTELDVIVPTRRSSAHTRAHKARHRAHRAFTRISKALAATRRLRRP